MFDSVLDFGWGGSPLWGGVVPGFDFGPGNSNGQATTNKTASTNPSWWEVLLGRGTDAFKSWLNFDLAQQQIKNGQYPSVYAGGPNVLASATTTLSSLIGPLIIIAVVVLVVRMVGGSRHK